MHELELFIDHTTEATHALTNAIGFGEAVRQSNRLPPVAIDVKGGSRHVGHAGGHGPRQHRGAIHPLRQGHPDVETAGGMGPGGAIGHVLGQGFEGGIAALAVHLAEDLDLVHPRLGVQIGRNGELRKGGRAQDGGLRGQGQFLANAVRSDSPPNTNSSRERLTK